MPYIAKKLKKVHEKQEEKQKRQEEKQQRQQEEAIKKEQEEKERQKEEKKAQKEQKKQEHRTKVMDTKRQTEHRENVAKRMAQTNASLHAISKIEGPKQSRDEAYFERMGYGYDWEELAIGKFSKLHKAMKGENDNLVVKNYPSLNLLPSYYRKNLLKHSLKIMRFVGSSGSDGEPKAQQFVKVYDIFTISGDKVYIFMDLCQKKSLNSVIKASEAVSEENTKNWCKQVLEGINALYGMGVAHRNIRPENVIFHSENNIRIVGFGMCCIYWDTIHQKSVMYRKVVPNKHIIDEYNHLPPEVFHSKEYDPSVVDVWSFGVLLCTLLTKQSPFDLKLKTVSFEEQWQKYSAKHKNIPESAKQLLDKIFVIEVGSRITIAEVLTDTWLNVSVETPSVPVSTPAKPNVD